MFCLPLGYWPIPTLTPQLNEIGAKGQESSCVLGTLGSFSSLGHKSTHNLTSINNRKGLNLYITDM